MGPIEYTLIRSDRRTVSIRITPEVVEVRAPRRLARAEIDRFVRSKREWIEAHLAKLPPRQPKFTEAELHALADRAREDLPARVRRFAPVVGVAYGRITIRSQHTRWGSCSAKGNLNFNCLLMLAPEPVRDYVVVHELCHRLEMNHSPEFWANVARVLPDHRERQKWLRDHGPELIGRL